MKKISYIVPVYKAEKYLSACIESILAQKSEDIELILVDDGSPDGSGGICDEYAAADPRVTVIHQENGGVSSARNAGLLAASGEYIRFVDSDDRICENEEVTLLENSTADLIVGRAVVLDAEGRVKKQLDGGRVGEVATRELLATLTAPGKRFALHYVWNHFYRRELIEENRLCFDTSVSLGEDFLFNAAYCKHCRSVMYIEEAICYYYKRDSLSLTGIFREGEVERRRKMDGALLSLYKAFGLHERCRAELDLMMGETAYLSLLKIRNRFPKKAYRKKLAFVWQMLGSEYYGLILGYLSSGRFRGKAAFVDRFLIRHRLGRIFYLYVRLKDRIL